MHKKHIQVAVDNKNKNEVLNSFYLRSPLPNAAQLL